MGTKQKITKLKKEINKLTASMYVDGKQAEGYAEMVNKRCNLYGELVQWKKQALAEKKGA